MITGIDHVVVISNDLDEAISNATTAGFTVIPGGTHKDGTTHNALIAFKDGSYIELIAPTNGTDGKDHRWFPRLRKGGGLVDLCLASDDLAADVQRIREHGRAYSAAQDNGRARPDGVELRWKGSMPPGEIGETGWPFLIEDVTDRANRVSNDPAQTTHENGALGIAGITVLTDDLPMAMKDFSVIADSETQPMKSPIDDQPIAAIVTFGDSWLMLTNPSAGEAVQHLERYGQGPYAVSLRTHDGPITPGSGREIDHALLSGAKFELV